MKKLTLMISAICLLSQTPTPVLCTEVDRYNGYDLHAQVRPHFKTSIEDSVLKITAADLNITDDSIVEAIKHPRPLSVSEALESIQNESLQLSARGKRLDIDLSSNTICDQGASLIGNYFKDNNALIMLDLSWNRMTDDGIANLLALLKPVLIQPMFSSLNIKGNYGANTANIRKILTASFSQVEQETVRGKIQI